MRPILIAAILLGCTSAEEISWETQEDARRQVNENVEFISRKFRSNYYPNHRLIMRGDSTIGKNCAQGDGWASIDLIDDKAGDKVEAKCSTVSEALGCMTKDDFNKRDYSSEEGTCNKNIPYPIPKVKQ